MVHDQLHWGNSKFLGLFTDARGGVRLVVDIGCGHCVHALERVGYQCLVKVVVRHFSNKACTPCGLVERGNALSKREMCNFVIRGVSEQRMHAALEAHQDADGTPSGLRNDFLTRLVRFCQQRKSFPPHFAAIIQLVDIDTDCCARSSSKLLHPRPFVYWHAGMFWGKLENAVPHAPHCVGNAK